MSAIQLQVTNEQYHADTSAISSSGLKLLRHSPKHFWAQYLDPDREQKKSTDAMEFGTLVHAMVLEPETVESEFATMPNGIDKRTKAGKAFWDELSKKNEGKTVVAQNDFELAQKVAKSVLEHPVSSLIYRKFGIPEFTLQWKEEVQINENESVFVDCKARLDWAIAPQHDFQNGLVLDLKTTKDASESDFTKSAYNLGYHIQAAWYSRAMFMAYGVENTTPFIFIAAEKESPFGVMAYKASQDFMTAGWAECKRLLKVYAKCLTENKWPCYPTTIQEINLPKWAKENYV